MKFLFWIASFYLLLLSDNLWASVYIIYPENSTSHKTLATKIQEKLNRSSETKVQTLTTDKVTDLYLSKDDLMVYIGAKATEASEKISNQKIPSIYTFQHPIKINFIKPNQQWSLININQPTQQFLKTARKFVSRKFKKNILIIITDDDQQAIESISTLKNKANIKVISIKPTDIAAKVIEPELPDTAAIIAIYNTKIWSGNSARWLLQQAYSYKVPIIGYSQSFLKAGAMVSVYSSAEQIIQETEKQIKDWQATGKLSNKITYPDYNIEINKNIAKALNFSDMDIAELGNKE